MLDNYYYTMMKRTIDMLETASDEALKESNFGKLAALNTAIDKLHVASVYYMTQEMIDEMNKEEEV